jgi:hypothetical protein
MLTLDVRLKLPAHVSFTLVEEDAILLNTQTNKYYALDEVGARLWGLLNEGKRLKEAYQILLDEYEVEPARLEKDLLELIDRLMENGLVEIAQG